uniref:3-hydroxyisobutyrate dehydrogenase n=1 Tax=Palpitomonas bilix TaxID=652834 RepID=A0A7S3D6Y6_9EUKA|mmetsp:Transcript_24718/g.62565  ORF Transcript_24718/g.62565 Transcript_24718/m.62565 type:complete len:329 (+) Transcript_24718:74-1060(+)
MLSAARALKLSCLHAINTQSIRALCTTGDAAKVAFIGLGNMGLPMAKNLLKSKFNVTVFDLNEAAISEAVASGASAAQSAVAASEGCDVVVTMLPSSKHVSSVYSGEQGIFSVLNKGALAIDCSTIEPQVAQALTDEGKKVGVSMIDAPVSGGTIGATNATLTFMVGGSKQCFGDAKPLLEAMGKNIVYCGHNGHGQIAKICNNLILGVTMAGVAEAMNLGTQLGADAKKLAGIINTSSGRCWSSDTYNPCPGVMEGVPSSRGFTGGFACDLMMKDMSLAVTAAYSAESPVPMGAAAQQLYQLMHVSGNGSKDFSGIFEILQGGHNKQ